MSNELWRLSAVETVARLKKGELSPLDLVEASARRIAEVEPAVNALPTLCLDRARDHAKRIMQGGAGCEAAGEAGWLAGLPVSIKDLTDVAGVRTTYGSPLFADHVPAKSHPLVERIERKGGIVMGKSNTPEFGAGGSTFNEVFGRTRKPLEHRPDLGRLDRRRRGVGGDRRGLAGAGDRSWRLVARSRQPLLGGRAAAVAGAGDARYREQSVEPAFGAGADGAQCRRPGPVPRHDGGVLSARPADLRRSAGVIQRRRGAARSTQTGRIHRRLQRPHAGRP
jgi:hypothetical protein